MIRSILNPEAQSDPYVWSAVLLAHAAIGAAGWAALSWWSVAVYLAFEVYQALTARRLYAWDTVLDGCGFTCGAVLACGLWTHSTPVIAGAALCCGSIAAAGWSARA